MGRKRTTWEAFKAGGTASAGGRSGEAYRSRSTMAAVCRVA